MGINSGPTGSSPDLQDVLKEWLNYYLISFLNQYVKFQKNLNIWLLYYYYYFIIINLLLNFSYYIFKGWWRDRTYLFLIQFDINILITIHCILLYIIFAQIKILLLYLLKYFPSMQKNPKNEIKD